MGRSVDFLFGAVTVVSGQDLNWHLEKKEKFVAVDGLFGRECRERLTKARMTLLQGMLNSK